MNTTHFKGIYNSSGLSFRQSRYVFAVGKGGEGAKAEKPVRVEVVESFKTEKEVMEGKLSDAVARLENKMKEFKGNPRYKDIVAIAEARLNSAKMKNLSSLQIANIIEDLRLSIISANRQQMTKRLMEIDAKLSKERDLRLSIFKKRYEELKNNYGKHPDTIKALDKSYLTGKREVELLYHQQRQEAQTLYAEAFRNLSPAIDEVTGAFLQLDLEYDKIEKNKIVDLNIKVNDIIDPVPLEASVRGVYLLEAAKGKEMRMNLNVAVLEFMDKEKQSKGEKTKDDVTYTVVKMLQEEMSRKFNNLDNNTNLSPRQRQEAEAKLSAEYSDRWKNIQSGEYLKKDNVPTPDRKSLHAYLDRRSEGQKKA